MMPVVGGLPPMQTLEDRRAAYERAFRSEATRVYPLVNAFEARAGYAIDGERLLDAARVLACPLKAHSPNWQHGRILYAAARQYLADVGHARRVQLLDIGTAKGFSALCLRWAMIDAGAQGQLVSVDVIDPRSRERRNTVAELESPKTLTELLEPWPEAAGITFQCSTGIDFLKKYGGRIEIAFVDGKHTGAVVAIEGTMLADRQLAGDLVIFDDVHLPDVKAAVARLTAYTVDWLPILPLRAYALARRR